MGGGEGGQKWRLQAELLKFDDVDHTAVKFEFHVGPGFQLHDAQQLANPGTPTPL